jgi:hypothetical protein
MNTDKTWVLVFVTNDHYLHKTFQTIYEVRTIGEWTDEIIILTTAEVAAKTENIVLCKSLNAEFRILPKRDFSAVLEFWDAKPYHGHSHYMKNRIFQFMKFYVMDVWFKKWDIVFYMDAGMKVQGPLSRMKAVCSPSYSLLAHSDAYPEFEKVLESQFELTLDSYVTEKLLLTYRLNRDYFQTTLMIFDTRIIEATTVNRLFELMNTFPITTRNDQGIFNLLFVCERGLWKQIEKKDSIGFLYDFHERPGFTRSDYLIMKYPIEFLL